MAEMLENNAKNKNVNVFVNKLGGGGEGGNADYAEVEGFSSQEQGRGSQKSQIQVHVFDKYFDTLII